MTDSCAEIRNKTGRTTLTVRGTAGIAEAAGLQDAALEAAASGNAVTVSLAEAERLDASALQVLLALRASLAANRVEMRWDGCTAQVAEYLALAGVEVAAR